MRTTVVVIVGIVGAACQDSTRDVAPIRLDAGVTIGATEGAGALATWPRVSARHPGGYRILVPQPGGVVALPAVYGDDGTFLGVLGSAGDAPEQFREPLFVRFGPGDSLYVFDAAQQVLVFGPDRRYGRTIPLPFVPWDAVVLGDGRMVVASSSFDHPLPLLLVGSDGAVVREIGASDSVARATPSPRRVLAGPDGSYWTVLTTGRWRIEHWDTAGALIGVIERTPPWYPPYQRELSLAGGIAPQPTLQDGWFDSEGRIWLLGKAADAKWEEGIGTKTSDAGIEVATIEEPDRVSDTVLEVIDPTTGQLVAEGRFDPAYPFAVEPGVVARIRVTGDGWHRAELAKIILDTLKLRSKP